LKLKRLGTFLTIEWLNVVVIPVTDINGKVIALKGIHKMFLKKTNSEESRSKLKLLLNY
jgi:hypothetical protein